MGRRRPPAPAGGRRYAGSYVLFGASLVLCLPCILVGVALLIDAFGSSMAWDSLLSGLVLLLLPLGLDIAGLVLLVTGSHSRGRIWLARLLMALAGASAVVTIVILANAGFRALGAVP